MLTTYRISDIKEYINWGYFFHAWGLPPKFSLIANIHGCEACRSGWVESFEGQDKVKARESLSLYKDALRLLNSMESHTTVKGLVKLFPCYSEEDDIMIEDNGEVIRMPMLRQQRAGDDGYCLCLADFLHDSTSGTTDTIGIFATSVSFAPPPVSASNSIKVKPSDNASVSRQESLLLQTLSDRLSEAAAERLHEEVRKVIWGYSPEESLSISDLHSEKYQGIRPSIGYPCLPDMSINFIVDKLIDFSRIGITLTEHGMMQPHSSVSGLMLSHPLAHYFDVGEITEEQLIDYSRRRDMPVGMMRKFLKNY